MENLYLYPVLLLSFLFLIHYNFLRYPKACPIIGHLYLMIGNYSLIRDSPEVFFQKLLSKYGSVLLFKFGLRSVLVVSCPEAVNECFTRNDAVLADRPETLASDLLSYHYKVVSFVQHNQLCTTIRRLMHQELLSAESLKNSSVFRDEENADLLRGLASLTTTKTVDLKNWFYLLVYNIAMRVVSGVSSEIRYEELETEQGKKNLEEKMTILRPRLPFSACDYFPVLRVFRFLGMGKGMKILHEKRNEFMQEIIDDFHRKKPTDPSRDTTGKKTFLETLLQKQESDSNLYSNDMIKALLLSMFVAGTETSAVTMETAISLLLDHPEEMERLREEIDRQVGTDRILKDEDLNKMNFLKCVIMETLRLYPPVKVILPHLSKEDCKVQGKHIPKGTTLLVNAWAMHRDPKVWEEPEKFKPERFESLELDQEPFKFPFGKGHIPFGMGRRGCPGTAMALRTILMAVGSLVQCFNLEKVKKDGNSDPIGHVYQCSLKPAYDNQFSRQM